MFDEDGQMICWFDSELMEEAVGIPEGELDEFMLSLEGPVVIIDRAYASTGKVKAVILKDFGLDATKNMVCDPMESLQRFVRDFGLTFISRPRSGKSLDFNGGRYYSPEHDPIYRQSGIKTI